MGFLSREGAMWQLAMTNEQKEWIPVGSFENLRSVVQRINQIEETGPRGIFFEILAESNFGTDEEFLAHLEYKGRRALYAVKRRLN
jgi:hypothetical protein